MADMPIALSVAGIGIRRDADGRFCLNDLHRASGGEKRHGPSYWLENQQTKDLVAALTVAGNPVSEKISHLEPIRTVRSFTEEQGTFVIKELVYAYAMWISPAFHLAVIRAYDAMVTGVRDRVAHVTRSDLARMVLESEAENAQLRREMAEQAPKVRALERIAGTDGAVCLTVAAKNLRMGRDKLIQWMHAHGWIYRSNGAWVPYQKRIEQGVLVLRVAAIATDDGERLREQVLVTAKGLARLSQLLETPLPADLRERQLATAESVH